MLYRIRPATPEDHDFIYGLKAESVRPYVEKIWGWEEAYQRADFDADFSAIEQFHVVEADGGRAGFVQYNRHNSCLEIVEIHLLPAYRGHGIGSDLIRHLQKECIGNLALCRWRKRTPTSSWNTGQTAAGTVTNPPRKPEAVWHSAAWPGGKGQNAAVSSPLALSAEGSFAGTI